MLPSPVLFAEMTWPAIAEVVAGGETLCMLPVGATEQHGRHLPASTDTDIGMAVCHQASRETGVPVLPALSVSASQVHTDKWPGTLSLPPRLLVEVVIELSRWVHASGFRKLLIANAHVANAAPLKVAVDEIRAVGHLRAGLVNCFELSPTVRDAFTADAEDWHANEAETSLMLHLRPELVRAQEIRDEPDRTGGLVFSYTVAETSMEGLTGTPSRASAERGEVLFKAMVQALVRKLEAARAEVPPFSQ